MTRYSIIKIDSPPPHIRIESENNTIIHSIRCDTQYYKSVTNYIHIPIVIVYQHKIEHKIRYNNLLKRFFVQ